MKKILIILITLCSLIYIVKLSNLAKPLPNCEQLSQASCVISKGLSDPIELSVTPYPIRVEQLHIVNLQSKMSFKVVDAQLIGLNMNMGRIPLMIQSMTPQHTKIELIPASCVNPKMRWQLQLIIEQNNQNIPLQYNFETQL